jgi:hypothetical protein
MRKNYWWITCAVLLLSISIISWKSDKKTNTAASSSSRNLFENYVDELYQAAHLGASGLDEAVFQKAVTGFLNLKANNKISPFSSILTVIDLNRPSHEKRMWIVDMVNETLLLNTWVAHGQGSGVDTANTFSNTDNSHQSSLGFYLTDDVYFGKHGRSLHLDGLDEGFNSSARQREIVVHAADYVSQSFIDQNGRIGRSWGCPAVAPEVAGQVIDDIKGKTVMFINGNDATYTSKYLDEDLSANYVFPSGIVGGAMAKL